jgi:hypothetical protein
MDKIPPELLHNIFIQLNLQQRLLCLNVCRSWWRVLDKHSLFYSVEMREDNLQFYRMMKLLQQFPDRAAQVVNLDVVIAADSFFNSRKLINIFPNARVIRVTPYAVLRLLEFVRHNLLTETTHLKPTVESLSEYHHCDLLSQMLYSGLLGRLKVLDLNFHGVEDVPPILSQLKDLPVLKKAHVTILSLHPGYGHYCTLYSLALEPGSHNLSLPFANRVMKFHNFYQFQRICKNLLHNSDNHVNLNMW